MPEGVLDAVREWQVLFAVAALLIGGPLLVRIWQGLGVFIRAARVFSRTYEQDAIERARELVRQQEQRDTLAAIAEQFRANGGTNLRDVIDRMDGRIERIERWVDEHGPMEVRS
jgi:Sec-independent protein translocase protein TatA